jgi:hypothetical protein
LTHVPAGEPDSTSRGHALFINPAARANVENGDRVSGFFKHNAEALNAQPESINTGQSLDVAGLRGRVFRILLDLRPDQLRLVGVADQGAGRGGLVDDRFYKYLIWRLFSQ